MWDEGRRVHKQWNKSAIKELTSKAYNRPSFCMRDCMPSYSVSVDTSFPRKLSQSRSSIICLIHSYSPSSPSIFNFQCSSHRLLHQSQIPVRFPAILSKLIVFKDVFQTPNLMILFCLYTETEIIATLPEVIVMTWKVSCTELQKEDVNWNNSPVSRKALGQPIRSRVRALACWRLQWKRFLLKAFLGFLVATAFTLPEAQSGHSNPGDYNA